MIGNSNDESNFPLKLILTNIQYTFANSSSTNIKLSKTQLYKIGQSPGFLGIILGPLLKPYLNHKLKGFKYH